MFARGAFGGLLLRLAISNEGDFGERERGGDGQSVVTLRRCLGYKNAGFRFFRERLEKCLGETGRRADFLVGTRGKKGGGVDGLGII